MNRRTLLTLSLPAFAAALPVAAQQPAPAGAADLDTALARFRAIPGRSSYLIAVGADGRALREAHAASDTLFVGSAVKTFILARYLQDVKAGRLKESEPLRIDDAVRSPSSPVLLDMTGRMPARYVLEAMISHSDNTATDACLLKAGPERVRAFIAKTGLHATRIPDSTRRLFSYLVGAPEGVDVGWAAMRQAMDGKLLGKPRSPLNDKQTMVSSAEDMVSYYQRALRGAFFSKPETLVEFKRILAMADAISRAVPADHAAYAKGGSIDWEGFHALCFPGQMMLGSTPATFCFTLNWTGSDKEAAPIMADYLSAVTAILLAVARRRA